MNYLRLTPVLFLTGCIGVDPVEADLNDYASVAMQRDLLGEHLTGSALVSALETADLIESLGLKTNGISKFSKTENLGDNRYRSCLDVSETSFVDASGMPVFLDRLERQRVLVTMRQGKISELELEGEQC